MLGVIVVPRDVVVVQKCEKSMAVLFQALLALHGSFSLIVLLGQTPEKAICTHLVFSEEPGFQAKTIHGFNHRLKQPSELGHDSFHLLVEGFLKQVIVEVSNQVDEAPLLWAIQGVICGVEIRNQHALEILEQ